MSNRETNGATPRPSLRPLTLAVPKGRILKVLAPLLEQAGIAADCLLTEDRRLVRENRDGSMRFLLLKPDDVPTYVEYGSAAIPAVPRVATKYPRIAQKYFASCGVQAEVIFVQGSVELAPVTGLSDLIVDLVETGATLRENGLEERELICPISSLLVANRSLFKLHHQRIAPLVDGLRRAADKTAS
jgi:ATP phosphoribosyltransferase